MFSISAVVVNTLFSYGSASLCFLHKCMSNFLPVWNSLRFYYIIHHMYHITKLAEICIIVQRHSMKIMHIVIKA